MGVYIVILSIAYEGEYIMSVHSSLEKAQAESDERTIKTGDSYYVSSWEVI